MRKFRNTTLARHAKTRKWSVLEDRVPAATRSEVDRAVVGATLSFMQEPRLWTRDGTDEITDVAFSAILDFDSLLGDETLQTTTMSKKHKDILKEGILGLNLQDKTLEHCMSTEPAVIADTSTNVLAVVATSLVTTASNWGNTVVHKLFNGDVCTTFSMGGRQN